MLHTEQPDTICFITGLGGRLQRVGVRSLIFLRIENQIVHYACVDMRGVYFDTTELSIWNWNARRDDPDCICVMRKELC